MDLKLQDNESMRDFVKRGIRLVFSTLAEELGQVQMTEDQAGCIPFQVFTKCEVLTEAWDRIAGGEHETEI